MTPTLVYRHGVEKHHCSNMLSRWPRPALLLYYPVPHRLREHTDILSSILYIWSVYPYTESTFIHWPSSQDRNSGLLLGYHGYFPVLQADFTSPRRNSTKSMATSCESRPMNWSLPPPKRGRTFMVTVPMVRSNSRKT